MSISSRAIVTFLVCISLSTYATKDLLDVIPTVGYLGQDAWSVVASYMGYDDLPASLFPLPSPLIASFQHATDKRADSVQLNGPYSITTAQEDNKVCLWNAATGNLLQVFSHTSEIGYACLDQTNTYLFTISGNNTYVWDIVAGKGIYTFSHTAPIHLGYFSKDSQRIVTASADNTVCIWDTNTGNKLQTLAHTDFIRSAEFNFDGSRVITCENSHIHVWDTNTGKKLYSLEHPDKIHFAVFNNNDTQIAALTYNCVYLWNTKTQKIEHTLKHAHLPNEDKTNEITSINYAHKNSLMVTAGIDHYVRIWDTTTGKEIRNLHYEPNYPTTLFPHFSSHDNYIITTVYNGECVDIWDPYSGIVLYKTRLQIDYADCNEQETQLATMMHNTTVHVWDISLAKALAVNRLSPRQFVLLHLLDKEFQRSHVVSLTALAAQDDVALKQVQDTFTQFDEKIRTFLTTRYIITA